MSSATVSSDNPSRLRSPLNRVPKAMQDTWWVTAAFAVRSLAQALTFLVVASRLQAANLGLYAGVVAVVALASPFSTWGMGNVLVMEVSRDRSKFPIYWGSALAALGLTGAALGLGVCAVVAGLFGMGVATSLALPLVVADMAGMRGTELAAQAFQAWDRHRSASALLAVFSLSRLIGAIAFAALRWRSPYQWAFLNLFASCAAALIALGVVRRALGWGPASLKLLWRNRLLGFHFSIGLFAQTAYNDSDKTVLAASGERMVAGSYAFAYRILDAAFLPIRSLLYVTYPRFFRRGSMGVQATSELACMTMLYALGCAVLVSVGVMATRGLVPELIGASYEQVPQMLVWLVAIVLLRAIHYPAADALTGAGEQGTRSGIQGLVALLNLFLNIILIPRVGWRGAAASSIGSDGLLAVLLWRAVLVRVRRSPGRQGAK